MNHDSSTRVFVGRKSTNGKPSSPLRGLGARPSTQMLQSSNVMREDRIKPSITINQKISNVSRNTNTDKQGSPLRGKTFSYKESAVQRPQSQMDIKTPRSGTLKQDFRNTLAPK